jgi:type IV pilus assembly protein PilM
MTSTSLSLLRPVSIVVDSASEPQARDSQASTAKPKLTSLQIPRPQLDLGALKRSVSMPKPPALGDALKGSVSLPSFKGSSSKGGGQLVGLDIQPGYVAAVQARVNGSLLVQRAAGVELPGDVVREGEVLDESTLSDALRELFHSSHLDRRVRIGVANQRTVLRILELPPITDRKELEAAVRFQAEDQVPMPLDSATLDFHPLGIVDTPGGPRQRVIVVAAQREMVARLVSAVRGAGLRPEAVDLSAFALIRSLYEPSGEETERVLYLNVGGLTNVAIAEGKLCRFTRVISGGLESMAGSAAARHNMPLREARELLAAVDLTPEPQSEAITEPLADADPASEATEEPVPEPAQEPTALQAAAPGPDLRPVLESGVREIAGEVRNSLEFHRLQEGGGEVSTIVLSGPALGINGFAQALESELSVPVRTQSVGVLSDGAAGPVPAERLAVAAGLAVEEAPR